MGSPYTTIYRIELERFELFRCALKSLASDGVTEESWEVFCATLESDPEGAIDDGMLEVLAEPNVNRWERIEVTSQLASILLENSPSISLEPTLASDLLYDGGEKFDLIKSVTEEDEQDSLILLRYLFFDRAFEIDPSPAYYPLGMDRGYSADERILTQYEAMRLTKVLEPLKRVWGKIPEDEVFFRGDLQLLIPFIDSLKPPFPILFSRAYGT